MNFFYDIPSKSIELDLFLIVCAAFHASINYALSSFKKKKNKIPVSILEKIYCVGFNN